MGNVGIVGLLFWLVIAAAIVAGIWFLIRSAVASANKRSRD